MNQRTIKFRCWDPKEKEMFVPEVDGNINKELAYLSEENGYVVMQFTGRTDREGNEIYEEDLFKCIYERDGHTDHIYVVRYSESRTGFILKRYGNPCPQAQVNQTISDVARYEKIGNSFENPDFIPSPTKDNG